MYSLEEIFEDSYDSGGEMGPLYDFLYVEGYKVFDWVEIGI